MKHKVEYKEVQDFLGLSDREVKHLESYGLYRKGRSLSQALKELRAKFEAEISWNTHKIAQMECSIASRQKKIAKAVKRLARLNELEDSVTMELP